MLTIRTPWRAASALALSFVVLSVQVSAQDAQSATATKSAGGKKVLTLADYGRWNRITGSAISGDGKWFTYAYSPNDGDGTMYVKSLDGDKLYTFPRGTGAAFSDDSKWIAFFVAPPSSRGGGAGRGGRGGQGGGAAAAQGANANRMLHVLNVVTGAKDSVSVNGTFRFAKGSAFLTIKKNKPNGQEFEGTDLIVRDLRSGNSLNFGNVDEFAFNDASTLLAYVVDASNHQGNGLFLYDAAKGTVSTLSSAALEYNQLTWDKNGTALAVLKGEKKKGNIQRDNALLVFTGVGTLKQTAIELDPAKEKVLPEGFVVSELSPITFSKDDSRVFFGLKEQEAEAPKSDDPQANVDVWHWKDEDVQSVQMVRAEQNRRLTYAATLNLATKKFLKLADDDMRTVTPTTEGKWGIGRLDQPYRHDIAWGGGRADMYRVDLNTGERKLLVKGLMRPLGNSPDGRWYLYFKDKQVIAQDINTGETKNLSQNSGVDFTDKRDDHPYELPTYGLAGWSADGKSVLLNHDFDIWSLPLTPTGKAVNLTAGIGDAEQIRFRYVDLDADAPGGRGGGGGFGGGGGNPQTIDTSKPIVLSAYGERTKKSGYYQIAAPGAKPTPLVYADASIGALNKADHADRIVYTRQTFTEFPDYYTSNLAFAAPRKITDANPQQSEYAWSPGRVLIDYTDARGNKLQGTLALPAGYEPGKKYPMLVYFYELMSDQHHRYSQPVYDDRPHMSTYTSNGYLVLQPDVVYTIGKPGTSAVDDVTSAVKKVIELGYADPKHIGLQGHSWGGYQSSFILTQTGIFAAVVTGAPPTNLVSFYDELYKSTGTVQQGIMEVGQVRMGAGVTPWTAHELYESQSPIHQAEKIKTPFLILQGTADGAVDWHQGLEYYNAARRLGKEVIFLSYPDEPHHLAKEENQKDFQIRMKQFFDHYLKDAPAPKWMTDGVPFLQKGKEKAGAVSTTSTRLP